MDNEKIATVVRQPWQSSFPNNARVVGEKLDELIGCIQEIRKESRVFPKLNGLSRSESRLNEIRSKLRSMLGVANLSKEKIDEITKTLRELQEIENTFNWNKLRQEHAELLEAMQKEDLKRVQAGIEQMLKTERELMEELFVALQEITDKLNAQLKDLQDQLAQVTTDIHRVEGEIKDLNRKLEVAVEAGVRTSIEYYAGLDGTLEKIGLAAVSQKAKGEIAGLIRDACDPKQNVGISIEVRHQRLIDKVNAHLYEDQKALGATSKQLDQLKQELDKMQGGKLFAMMRGVEAVKELEEDIAQKEAELTALQEKHNTLSEQVNNHEDLLNKIKDQPINRETVQEARKLAKEQGITLSESEQVARAPRLTK